MGKERLCALTDGVVAVIITIMVLEMKPPAGSVAHDLIHVWPVFLSYILSFIYVAIYWNNHHHFFSLVDDVNGSILWSNMGLLFCISLIPFTTAWLGEHPHDALPVAAYGVVLLASAVGWYITQTAIIRSQGSNSRLAAAIGDDWKGKGAPFLYLAGVGIAFFSTTIAELVYFAVACLWLIPDRRVERAIKNEQTPQA
jgi:uncharacterized membrane protein